MDNIVKNKIRQLEYEWFIKCDKSSNNLSSGRKSVPKDNFYLVIHIWY